MILSDVGPDADTGGGRLETPGQRGSGLAHSWLLMLIRLFQLTARSSVVGECLVRPFAGLFASFRFSSPTKRPAKSTWPLAAGPRATSAHDARTIAVTVGRRPWQCAACCQQVSLTSGTILHNTKTPLTLWFWAAYLMTTDKRGVSALLLHHQLGLQRYETAWMILHKLRRATVNAVREPLHGEVEIDDTWDGGTQAGIRGSRLGRVVWCACKNRESVCGLTVWGSHPRLQGDYDQHLHHAERCSGLDH